MANFQISSPASYLELVQDSKFIGYCFLISSDQAAEQCLADLRRQHPKATHICWAYRLLQGTQVSYYADDAGEPRGSAGPPILHALERRQLVNTWCGVIRYFGGTKLGIGGLIRAYGRVAGRTLDLAELTPVVPTVLVEVHLTPARVSQIYNLLKHNHWRYTERYEGAEALFSIEVPEPDLTAFQEMVRTWGGVLIIN